MISSIHMGIISTPTGKHTEVIADGKTTEGLNVYMVQESHDIANTHITTNAFVSYLELPNGELIGMNYFHGFEYEATKLFYLMYSPQSNVQFSHPE